MTCSCFYLLFSVAAQGSRRSAFDVEAAQGPLALHLENQRLVVLGHFAPEKRGGGERLGEKVGARRPAEMPAGKRLRRVSHVDNCHRDLRVFVKPFLSAVFHFAINHVEHAESLHDLHILTYKFDWKQRL